MKHKIYESVVFKLIVAIIIIFIIMLLGSMYLINRKQSMLMNAVIEELQVGPNNLDKSVILFVDSSRIQLTTEFSVYLFFVMCTAIILGSISFALIIKKILSPLKNLQKNIGHVDIDRPESFEKIAIVDSTSSEIVELSESFDRMLKKIYADYKRQKDFSSNVAHELRTPITVMKSQLDLYKQKSVNHETENMIRVLDTNVNKLNLLVDAILSLRKKREVKPSKINLYGIFDEIILDLEDKASDKNVVIDVHDMDIDLITDDSLIQRLIYNIVDNAIKYNVDGGRVDISASQDELLTKIRIADTGIGISEKDRDRIFELFYQVDSSRGSMGYGIGLSLSKTIADMLDAKIRISANQPQGSIFIIEIPNTLT